MLYIKPFFQPFCRVLYRTCSTLLSKPISTKTTENGITLICLNRPKANALGKDFLQILSNNIDELRYSDCRAIIIHSIVPGFFCAGADLKERAGMSKNDVARFVHMIRTTFTNIENLPMPTIAVIDGVALGGGLELALACDIRIAGLNAKMGLTETKLAIIPGAGGTQRLPRVVGVGKAKELIFTGTTLGPEEALKIGLVNHVEQDPLTKAISIANLIVNNGPVAVKMAKLSINKGTEVDISTGLMFEQSCYAQVIPTKDRLIALEAFNTKTRPIFTGK